MNRRVFVMHIPAQNIDCEYPETMFLCRNKKKIGIPLKTPALLYKKWGLRGSELYRRVFMMYIKLNEA